MKQLIYSKDGAVVIFCPRDFEGTVVIANGTKGIRQNAFENCKMITNVIIPEGVVKIGSSAFKDCQMLSEIVLPEGLSYLGKSAFSRCYNLKSVKLPSSLKVLKDKAFYNNISLQQITFPEGLIEIEHNCFNWCRLLDEVVLPSSLYKLGNSFVDCESLSKVTIKSEVLLNYLDINKSFKGCYKLKKLRKLIDIEDDVYICNDEKQFFTTKGKRPLTKIRSYKFSTKKPLPDNLMLEIGKAFEGIKSDIVMPSLWKK